MTATINQPVLPIGEPTVDFTISPQGAVYTYVVGTTLVTTNEHITPTNTLITFTATAAFPIGRYAVEYHWNFGEGSEGWGTVATHRYTLASDFMRVTLTVVDNVDHKAWASHQLYLRDYHALVVAPNITLNPA